MLRRHIQESGAHVSYDVIDHDYAPRVPADKDICVVAGTMFSRITR